MTGDEFDTDLVRKEPRATIFNVDGWLYRVAGDVAFIEFRSGDHQAGGFTALDADGNAFDQECLGRPDDPQPWYRRVPDTTLKQRAVVDLDALSERAR